MGVICKCESQKPSNIWTNGTWACRRSVPKLMQSEFMAYNVRLVSKRHIKLCLMKSVVKVVMFMKKL